jgi:hypothetical protein
MIDKRLSIPIDRALQIRVQNTLPWGTTSKIMHRLLISVLDLVDAHGEIVIGAIMTGKLQALDLLKKGGDKSEPG